MARFTSFLATAAGLKGSPIGRTDAIRAAHDAERAAELAWPVGSQTLVPPPNGNQNLKLHELNALARGPNT